MLELPLCSQAGVTDPRAGVLQDCRATSSSSNYPTPWVFPWITRNVQLESPPCYRASLHFYHLLKCSCFNAKAYWHQENQTKPNPSHMYSQLVPSQKRCVTQELPAVLSGTKTYVCQGPQETGGERQTFNQCKLSQGLGQSHRCPSSAAHI